MGLWSVFFLGLGAGVAAAIPAAVVWTRRYVARTRRLEQRARAAERLADQATMTGGLAHEIKNPLSTINLNIQLLEEDLDQAAADAGQGPLAERLGRVRRRFATLGREVDRLRDTLEDFLRFAGRVELDRQPTDVNGVVRDLVDFFEPQATETGVQVRADLAAGDLTAEIDAGLVKQATLNLLINACQAMADARAKGTPHGGADLLLIRTRAAGGREPAVRVQVADTGPGMSPDAAARVFQPYYSTKRGGSGLGLPTARRLIDAHGGSLSLHTEPGRGSEFTIELPVAAAADDPNA